MYEFLGGMFMWHYWLIAAGVFFIGEIMTVGFLLFWLGISALIAMVVSFFTSNVIIQMSVFIISSIILILATKPLVKKFVNEKNVKTNAFSLVGKNALVIQDIDNLNSVGQIKVDGEIWSAQSSEDDINIPIDSEVKIVKIEGVKAIVKPIKITANK